MPHQSRSGTAKHGRFKEHKCCGIVEDTNYQVKKKRESRKGPQPWIVLKSMVFGGIGIVGYSAYVYIGRLCIPFIKGRRKAAGSTRLFVRSCHRAYPRNHSCFVSRILYSSSLGAMELHESVCSSIVIRVLLHFYYQIVLTSPGYARDVRLVRFNLT